MKKYFSVNKKSQSQKKENIMLPKRMLEVDGYMQKIETV